MAVAGFSVGELTAAIFSGAVTLRSLYIYLWGPAIGRLIKLSSPTVRESTL